MLLLSQKARACNDKVIQERVQKAQNQKELLLLLFASIILKCYLIIW